MTRRYILDENVVIYAQRGLDEYGNPNLDCSDLVNGIIDEDLRTLVVDDVLWDKYDDQLNNPSYHDAELGPYMMIRFWGLLQVPGKVVGLGHTAPDFPEQHAIPPGSQDDLFLIKLVVETKAILVTTDRALRQDLTTCGIQTRYDLCIVSPQETLAGFCGAAAQ
jgi:hypothetical protein